MKQFFKTVLLTGLFVGVTDIIAAHVSVWIQSGSFPMKVLQYIAGGALGLETSMKGGVGTGIARTAVSLFYSDVLDIVFLCHTAEAEIPALQQIHRWISLWNICRRCDDFLILPLSALPDSPFVFSRAIVGWSILGIVLGIPIAISAYRFYNIKPSASAVAG
jgi:hypothetical protein